MKERLLNKVTQKITILITLIMLIFNIIFPTYSQADIGGALAAPITTLCLLILDTIEGGLQYFFIGGPLNTMTVTFKEDDYKTIKNELKLEENVKVKKNNKGEITEIKEDVKDYQSWLDQGLDFVFGGDVGWDYVVTKFSPAEIFSNQIPMFSINFIDPPQSGQKTIASSLQGTIASWYKALRTLAFVGMLSMLVYVGIRIIISSTAADKAKYKNMIMDWVIALCLLFFLHYIMQFAIIATNAVTSMVASVGGDFKVTVIKGKEEKEYITNLMGLVRFRAQNKNLAPRLGYIIIYGMLVVYTVMFTFTYLKRVLMMAFLTVISPVVVLTYPIDKISDGSAQGFNMWLKEYVFNALLQPVHLILYTVLVGSAVDLAIDNPIYAIAAMAFILPAEKIMRKLFNFSKAQAGTMSGIEGFAGAVMAKNLIGSTAKALGKGGKSGGSSGSSESGGGSGSKLRMQNKANLGVFGKEAPKLSEGGAKNTPALTGANQAKIGDYTNRRDALQGMIDAPDTTPEDKGTYQDEVDFYNKELDKLNGEQLQDQGPTPGLLTGNEAQEALSNPESEQQEKRKIGNVLGGVGALAGKVFTGKNLKKLAKVGAGAGLAMTAGAMTLAGSGGDISKTLTAAGGGFAAGAVGVPSVAKAIGNRVGAAGGGIADTYREGAHGLLEAQRIKEQKALEKQKKEFMKDPANKAKYKEMAARLQRSDYKEVMEQAYDLRTSGVREENVEKTLEVALGKPGKKDGVGLDKAKAVAVQTQKYGTDILLDSKKSQVLQKKFANEIMAKGNGQLSEAQAQAQAKEVIKIYEKFA